ncbi:MAG: glycosyltransferase family 2 protein [Gemmataceae bacterium]
MRITSSSPRSLSLVIPAYNEQATIATAIAEAEAVFQPFVSQYEILVIDDGSTDGTAQVVESVIRPRSPVRLIRHGGNRGYGAALRTGFEAARMACVAFTDADCQFDLADLRPMLALTERYPIVVGYRVGRRDPWLRRFLSAGYNCLARLLLGTRVRDCDCALKVFRREALVQLLPETPGFFVNTEMLSRAHRLGLKVCEVGVRHRPRLGGTSKVSLNQIPRVLATLLPFWWKQVIGGRR